MALHPRIYLVPHFPGLLRPAAEGEAEPEVVGALRQVGARLSASGADVVVILSACWDEEGPFQVDNGARHKTLLDFHGVDIDLRYSCDGWVDLGNALHDNGLASGLPVETVHRGMDHSVAVPASLLFPEADRRIVPLSCSQRSHQDTRLWGEVVRETCRGAGASCVILAGGSLTYDPAAFRASTHGDATDVALPGAGGHGSAAGEDKGVTLDRRVLSLVEAQDWDGLARLVEDPEGAGALHAGLRHLWFLEGVLGDPAPPGRVLEYHRQPGVGSALVEFTLPQA